MSGQVTQKQEQGLALVVRRDQVNGFVREQIRRILAVVVRHIQVSSHVVTEIVFDKVFHRVVVVVEVDAQVTEVGVEASHVWRVLSLEEAQKPFSDHSRLVAGILEELRKDLLIRAQTLGNDLKIKKKY